MTLFIRGNRLVNPVLGISKPMGVEDINHPETRVFIGRQWQGFLETFDRLSEKQRVTLLQGFIREWEKAALERYEETKMTGLFLQIQHLAARSSLTAWFARQPTPATAERGDFYTNLLRYSAAMHIAQREVSPHLAFAAVWTAGLHPEDIVRINDAGDGLVSVFAGDIVPNIEYTDINYLRRAIFKQLLPRKNIVTKSTGPVDVLLTENRQRQTPTELLQNVHPGGRLIIYGDLDWHHISAYVIGKLAMFDDVVWYAASLPRTLDEASRAMHLQLFVAWKILNKQIRGTLNFRGEVSAYDSESGVVIVIDNVESTDMWYEEFNLSNPQARPFENYVTSFDKIRETRCTL